MRIDPFERRAFEYRVLDSMRCPTFDFEAYRNDNDLGRRQSPATSLDDGRAAVSYLFIMRVPTLKGPGSFSPETQIGVNIDVPDYPVQPPRTWLFSSSAPWSPHFLRQGQPVCIGGEFWLPKKGHVTLGHLAQHLARLLNWDEKGRGPGYVGWNGPAIAYHRSHYGNQPLDPTISYPQLPAWLSGDKPTQGSFAIVGDSNRRPAGGADLRFKVQS